MPTGIVGQTEPEWIDTHSHLFLEEFDEDRDEAVSRAQAAGIAHLYLPNIDSASLPRLLDMVRRYPEYVSPLIGLHPTSVAANYREELDFLYAQLQKTNRKTENAESDCLVPYVGIGEIGMDLYWDDSYKKEQEEVFREQLCWAKEFSLPVCIHCRKAFPETFEIVSQEMDGEKLQGIFHCFEGTEEEARKVLSLPNFYLGIGGVVTYKKSNLPHILKEYVPLERIVLETDCPYLAPVPKRGKRNESSYLVYTARKIAEIYGISPSQVAETTTRNARRLMQKQDDCNSFATKNGENIC